MSDTSAAYPNLNPTGTTTTSSGSSSAGNTAVNMKDSVINNASSAMDTVRNHPVTQSVTQGPMADKAREHMDKTSNEFGNVAASRRTPDQPAATGQPLTHYHSMFYNILSWENPRVSAIAFMALVSTIFFTRYVPVFKLFLKGTYIVLGITAAAEIAGKLVFDKGLTSQMRPRKYYTIPRENLERALEDVEQFINFFVIEIQRIVFAENVYATVAAFSSALFFYLLRKVTPTWGMALIATSVIFLAPLAYVTNKEFIDEHVNSASQVVNAQASQVRDLAAQHTGRASEVVKSTASQYTAKAQEMMGQTKQQVKSSAASPDAPNPANLNPMKDEPSREIRKEDFPSAPSVVPSTADTGLSSGGISQTEPHAQPGQPLPAL